MGHGKFLAAALALSGNLFYVFVYTMWLKRTSTQNIVIGGAAGAVPPFVGWARRHGASRFARAALLRNHFLLDACPLRALSLVRQEDYGSAGIPMLPVVRERHILAGTYSVIA